MFQFRYEADKTVTFLLFFIRAFYDSMKKGIQIGKFDNPKNLWKKKFQLLLDIEKTCVTPTRRMEFSIRYIVQFGGKRRKKTT